MNQESDITTTIRANSDGSVTVARTQDIEPILKAIHARQVEEAAKFKRLRNFREIGEVPFVVLEAWIRKRGMTFRDYVLDQQARKMFWKNSDHSKLRVTRGKI